MATANSSKQGSTSKKPHPDFPLFKHATGRWCKKVRGRFCYFGRVVDDPDGKAALEKWLEEKDDLLAGRTPRPKTDALTVRSLLNKFLTSKKLAAETGEITPRVFRDYHGTCKRISEVFGLERAVVDLTAHDFEELRARMGKTMILTSMKTEILKSRAVFNYAYNAGLIDRPVRFGPSFKTPSEKVLRKQRRTNGAKMFEREEIQKLLADAGHVMKAMILLGLNAGFGNNDCATLPRTAVDLERGWVTHPRPKTGADRRCPLWPETVAALRVVFARRPKAENPADDGLVFITQTGQPFVRLVSPGWTDSVQSVFVKLCKATDLKRPGRGFYALRHTFETIGGDSRDQVATDYIMGHLRGDMASVYRERISDDRLRAVVEHVRGWLFGGGKTK